MKIAIIGAGITGLAAAYDLTRSGHSVEIYEAAANAGGLAAGFLAEGWEWPLEHFYHHWFASDRYAIRLIQEIGLEDRLFFLRPITSIWQNGKAYQLDSTLSALLYPHLSLMAKTRFGLTGLYLKMTSRWQPLEKYTAHEWLLRSMGKEAYERLWQPLLIAKWGDYYQQVNMAWFWARIYKRTQRLGYMRGGFQVFVDRLVEIIIKQGGKILLKVPVSEIHAWKDSRLRLHASSGESYFDRIIVTLSPDLLLKLVPELQGDYRLKVSRLQSVGALVIIAALRHKLQEKTYWLNLPAHSANKEINEFPFMGLVEHTNYISAEHYAGEHIIYIGDYLRPDHPYFSMSKEALLELFLPGLNRINPNFDPSWITRTWLFKTNYAQPVPPINHAQNIPPLRTPLPGLFWASMSQVYPWDRGTNYSIEIGRRVAREAVLPE